MRTTMEYNTGIARVSNNWYGRLVSWKQTTISVFFVICIQFWVAWQIFMQPTGFTIKYLIWVPPNVCFRILMSVIWCVFDECNSLTDTAQIFKCKSLFFGISLNLAALAIVIPPNHALSSFPSEMCNFFQYF